MRFKLLVAGILILGLCVLATQGEAQTPPQPKPIEAYLVVPDGETYNQTILDEWVRWLATIEAWYEHETNTNITIAAQVIFPQRYNGTTMEPASMQELSSTSWTCSDGNTYYGLDETKFVRSMMDSGIGMGIEDRHWFLVLGAGGWAGGYTASVQDYGRAIAGDWDMYRAIHPGETHPCDAYPCPVGGRFCPPAGGWAYAHETTHAMDLDSHDNANNGLNYLYGPGAPFNATQVAQFCRSNRPYYVPNPGACLLTASPTTVATVPPTATPVPPTATPVPQPVIPPYCVVSAMRLNDTLTAWVAAPDLSYVGAQQGSECRR